MVVFVNSTIGSGSGLWCTDGTEAGTTPIGSFPGLTFVRFGTIGGVYAPTRLAEGLVVFGVGGTGGDLWASDGTVAGTVLLRDFNDAPNVTALGSGRGLFAALDGGGGGLELWSTDGAATGTGRVRDINPGPDSSFPDAFGATGDGRALLGASDTRGHELWISDGSEVGTTLVRDINPGPGSSRPAGFTFLGGGRFVFGADDGALGRELWITDGTAAGTRLVADIAPGPSPSDAAAFASLGDGRIVFAASDGVHGRELWVTDGTAAGTGLVADLRPGAAGSAPSQVYALGNGRALFSAIDDNSGAELWITDGTTAGTIRLRDLNPGTVGSFPDSFAALDRVATSDTFRFFDTEDGGHFYTTSRAERDQVLATRPDLRPEGIGFQTFGDAAVPGTSAVYRFFDTDDGGHFFTISAAERDQVLATRPDLRFEGVGYYAFASASGVTTDPVYRFFNTVDGGHFFTLSAPERDQVMATRPDLRFEGVAFFAPHYGVDFFP